jgi:hypothetical protein
VSNSDQYDHTRGGYCQQDLHVPHPTAYEPCSWTEGEENEGEERWHGPTVPKIPRPAHDKAVSNNDAWICPTSIYDAELPISVATPQRFGFFPGQRGPRGVMTSHAVRVLITSGSR